MKVTMISSVPNPDKIVAIAARVCVSSKNVEEISNSMDSSDVIQKEINRILESGHFSVLEHVSFTFAIEGVSRSLLAQLTRHRIASFSVRSQRYVSMKDVTPEEMLETTKASNTNIEMFIESYRNSINTYNELVDIGTAKEDARMVLPNATPTSLIMTMNAREIYHFCGLRMCNRAQKEIRFLAHKICSLVKAAAPITFSKLGPNCEQLGYCPESKKSCGKQYTLDKYKNAMNELNKAMNELMVMKQKYELTVI